MEMQDELVRVEIFSLTTTSASEGAFVLVLGEVGGIRKLAIVIGEGEATAIQIVLDKKQPPRPMSHDLLCDLMDHTGVEVSDILIDELEAGTFHAKIRFQYNGKYGALDTRPSDAVAVAIRLHVPMLVSESILEEAGVPAHGGERQVHEKKVEEQDSSPVEKLKRRLASAIEEEDYEEAARVRDALAKLKS